MKRENWIKIIIILTTVAIFAVMAIWELSTINEDRALSLAKEELHEDENLGQYYQVELKDKNVENLNDKFGCNKWDLSKWPSEQSSADNENYGAPWEVENPYGTCSPWNANAYPEDTVVHMTWYEVYVKYEVQANRYVRETISKFGYYDVVMFDSKAEMKKLTAELPQGSSGYLDWTEKKRGGKYWAICL